MKIKYTKMFYNKGSGNSSGGGIAVAHPTHKHNRKVLSERPPFLSAKTLKSYRGGGYMVVELDWPGTVIVPRLAHARAHSIMGVVSTAIALH